MMEKHLEQYLAQQAKKAGGMCLKWQNLNVRGIPDRLLFLPGGRMAIIETKFGQGGLRPGQKVMIKKLEELGFKVWVPRSRDEIDEIIEKTKNGG